MSEASQNVGELRALPFFALYALCSVTNMNAILSDRSVLFRWSIVWSDIYIECLNISAQYASRYRFYKQSQPSHQWQPSSFQQPL